MMLARCSRVALAALALIQVLLARHVLDPDGTSYLDIARAYARSDWHNALNSYWSPLYSWILALCMALFRPGPAAQLLIPHLISFDSFLGMIAAWEWLLREYERSAGQPSHPTLIRIAGYASLAWFGLKLNGMEFPSADIIVTVLSIVCAALLLRLSRGEGCWRNAIWLGMALGTGFLAKAAFAVLIVTVVPLLAFLPRPSLERRPDIRMPVVTLAVALAVILPFVIALSLREGRITLSRSGSLNYSWHVSGFSVEGYKDQTYDPGPLARHPFRVLMESPRVLSFEDHLAGSYPVHYNPAWWSEGYPVRFDAGRQWLVLKNNLALLGGILIECPALWLAAFCAAAAGRDALRRAAGLWFLWAPAFTMLLAYCAVYLLPRYAAAPCALLSLVFLAMAWRTTLPRARRWLVMLATVVFSLVVLRDSVRAIPKNYFHLARYHLPLPGAQTLEITSSMAVRGLRPGDRVAYIGNALSAVWAGLSECQIVAVVPVRIRNDDSKPGRPQMTTVEQIDRFWKAGPEAQMRVLHAFRAVDARWVVADEVPRWADTSGWVRVGAASNLRADGLPATYVRKLEARID